MKIITRKMSVFPKHANQTIIANFRIPAARS